jgi:hypothetical protein
MTLSSPHSHTKYPVHLTARLVLGTKLVPDKRIFGVSRPQHWPGVLPKFKREGENLSALVADVALLRFANWAILLVDNLL